MGVLRVNYVEAQFARIDAFLAYADCDAASRSQLAGALREHAWTLMEARPQHRHSFDLALIDLALIAAIAAFEDDHSPESVNALRERLGEFHAAVVPAHDPVHLAAAA